MPKPEKNIAETMTRLVEELRFRGKTLIHIDHEAQGDSDLAHRMLQGAAATAGVEVTTKDYTKAVSASVIPNDAEYESEVQAEADAQSE